MKSIVQPVNPARRPACARHRKAFDFICERANRGKPPSLADLAIFMGCKVTTITYVVDTLCLKGWISKRCENDGPRHRLRPRVFEPEE